MNISIYQSINKTNYMLFVTDSEAGAGNDPDRNNIVCNKS
jgi:hypothetical protein